MKGRERYDGDEWFDGGYWDVQGKGIILDMCRAEGAGKMDTTSLCVCVCVCVHGSRLTSLPDL